MSARPRRHLRVLLFAAVPLLLLATAWLAFAFLRQGGMAPFRVPQEARGAASTDPALLARGAYLARIGNCIGCHTASGGALLAGGRAFRTDWGTVYSSNLTPDASTGIGDWSLAEFAHAMRHGISRNGVQSPVFPYASFRHLDDADIAALFAWLATLPPVAQPRAPNALDFPATLPGAMTAWRLLYYRPAPLPALRDATDEMRRGRALVQGIGHCVLCHGSRGSFGAQAGVQPLDGGQVGHWTAPALHGTGLARFDAATLADYLRSGRSAAGSAYGPMADVVFANLQHLTPADARAVADYLLALPAPPPVRQSAALPARRAPDAALGERLYADACAECHGADGRGEPGKYPPLRGARSVVHADPANAVNVVLLGAMQPATAANPYPWSMPPFAHQLSAEEVAAVVNHVRARWGGEVRAVTAEEVRTLGSAFR